MCFLSNFKIRTRPFLRWPEIWLLHNIFHNWMLNSVEQRIIAGWCFTEDKRSQRDGVDGVQEHGGGLDHAADGAGLIHQIQDSTAVLRVPIHPRGKLSFFAFTLCCPHRWFLRPVDLLRMTRVLLYIALVSAADHLQYLLRSHAAMCAKQNGFCRRAKSLHTRITSIKLRFSKLNGSLAFHISWDGFEGCLKYFLNIGKVLTLRVSLDLRETFWVPAK